MRFGVVVGVVGTIWAGGAGAEGLRASPLPKPNPVYAVAAYATLNPLATDAGIGLTVSLRPKARPKRLVKNASASTAAPKATAKGAVCGVNAIKGAKIAPIKGEVKGCGLQDGVRVTSVSGVVLSEAITVDCPTAKALNTWVRDVLQPGYGGKVAKLQIAGHYTCRSRNNQKGAKMSEHGKGKAVDIAGFVLKGGKTVMVASKYNRTLRRVYKAACGIFGTTLGPGSDGFHEDHLHFDTASYRSGSYCR